MNLYALVIGVEHESRDDEARSMTEAIADSFSMHVAGGVSYITMGIDDSVVADSDMSYAIKGPGMDRNWNGPKPNS